MTLVAVALIWTGVSIISGLFVGNVLFLYGGDVGSTWIPLSTLDGAAIAAPESRLSPHHDRRNNG